jgi:polysaccharide export outer membrane protein
MAGGNLVTRVHALLNPNQARGRSGHRFAIATSLCAMLVGAVLTSVEAVERIMVIPVSTARAADASPTPPPALRPVVVERQTVAQANRPVAPPPSVRRDAPPAIQPPRSPAPVAASADYVIAAGDVLTITYWEQKELTGDYVVRPDGRITVPLLNDVEAAGLTPEQLRDRLTAVSARIVANPQITVGVREINSRRVYIVGGVVRPGPYDLVGGMTVMQLISVAGGLRDFVVGRGITILRNEDGQQRVFTFDYRAVISGQNLEQNIMLRPGDTVAVPE